MDRLIHIRNAEKLGEALVAVRLLVLLFEGAFVELLQAERANEMLGMEFLAHSGDTTAWKYKNVFVNRETNSWKDAGWWSFKSIGSQTAAVLKNY